MADLALPLLTVAIAAPLLSAAMLRAAIAWRSASARHARIAGSIGAAVALLCSLEATREVMASGNGALTERLFAGAMPMFVADPLNSVLMAVYAILTLASVLLTPSCDTGRGSVSASMVMLSATLCCYAAGNLLLLLVGFAASVLPLVFGMPPEPSRSGRLARNYAKPVLLASAVSLTIAILILIGGAGWPGVTASILPGEPFDGSSPAARWAFGFIILAAFLRKGTFPFHGFLVNAFDRGPLLLMALLLNGHLGAFLIARMAIPIFPELSREMLPWIANLALATALYTTVLALAERNPRRLLALLFASQSSFILAGLQSSNLQGITGGLTHWLVVAFATTGLIGAFRAAEARVFSLSGDERFAGLGNRMPRLAAFFAISGLALVGMPGTLGFCTEDLLFHGAHVTNPQLGVLLPIATALSAIHIYRLFASIFLGKRATATPDVPDALPRERWALSVCAVFLIASGLLPAPVMAWRSSAARTLTDVMETPGDALQHDRPAHPAPLR